MQNGKKSRGKTGRVIIQPKRKEEKEKYTYRLVGHTNKEVFMKVIRKINKKESLSSYIRRLVEQDIKNDKDYGKVQE